MRDGGAFRAQRRDRAHGRGKHLFTGGIRDAALLSTYVRMGAARCYFTGNDFMFLMHGAKAQVDAMLAADKLFRM